MWVGKGGVQEKAILSTIQAGFSCNLLLRCVMLGCIRPRSNRGPDKSDRHSFPIERMDICQNRRRLCYRKNIYCPSDSHNQINLAPC